MQSDLKNKVIIITGANSRFDKAASVQLKKPGATVVTACRSQEHGLRAPEEARSASAVWRFQMNDLRIYRGGCSNV